MYSDWKNFIETCEKPEKYDFKNQIEEWVKENPTLSKETQELAKKVVDEKDDPIKKFDLYRHEKLKKFDCDCCTLTKSIYRKVWNYRECGGDTMNSFQTIANWATGKTGVYSIKKIENLADPELKKQLEDYAKLIHTIGNFIPVPKGSFNGARYAPTSDFWDITLMCIRDYYLYPRKHTPLCSILHCNQKNKEWLDSFGKKEEGWREFIDDNYLKMYVNEKYKVDPLFSGNNYQNILSKNTEKNTDQIKEFLKNACNKIEERGKYIVKSLTINSIVESLTVDTIDTIDINAKKIYELHQKEIETCESLKEKNIEAELFKAGKEAVDEMIEKQKKNDKLKSDLQKAMETRLEKIMKDSEKK